MTEVNMTDKLAALPDALWEKYSDGLFCELEKHDFTAAIKEAMQAQRKMDAEILEKEAQRLDTIGTYSDDAQYVRLLAAAIEREPLP